MCGIAGALAFTDDFAADEATVRAHGGHAAPPRPRRRGRRRAARRPGRARPSPAVDHRPLARRAPADAQRGRERLDHLQRRGLQPRRAARRARGGGPPLSARTPTRRRSSTSTRRRARPASSGSRACSRSRSGTRAARGSSSRATASASSRCTTRGSRAAFVFGSEAKAVLEHPAVPRDLDEDAFGDYLTFGFTPAAVHPVPRRRQARPRRADGRHGRRRGRRVTRGGTRCRRRPSPSAAAAMGEDEMVAEVRRLLRESVGKRMMSDVPFGVFLSGGLDSSTNVALMAELSDAPVRTYSTAPRGHARYDELAYARIVAERFGTEHHEVLVDEAGDARLPARDALPPGRAALGLDGRPAALRHPPRARDRDDRRAGRRGRRRALPRLPRLRRPPADHRADPAVAAPARAPRDRRRGACGRRRGSGAASATARRCTTPARAGSRTGAARCASAGPLKERVLLGPHRDTLRNGRGDLGRGRRAHPARPTCSRA